MGKRWTGLVLALILLTGWGARAGAEEKKYVLQMPGGSALINEKGEELTPLGEYEEIYQVTEGENALYAAARHGQDGRYALMDGQGRPLTDFLYDHLTGDGENVIFLFEVNYGVMDSSGEVLIEPEYTQLVSNGQGGYLGVRTSLYDEEPDGVYLIVPGQGERATGARILYGLYECSAEGLIWAASADNGLWGFLDGQGRWAIQPAYTWAGSLVDGRAAAEISSGAGLIDDKGNWLITPKYDYVSYAGAGMPVVAGQGDTVYVIHPDTLKVTASYSEPGNDVMGYPAGEDLAIVLLSEGAVAVNSEGEELFSLEGCQWLSAGEKDGLLTAVMGDYGTRSAWLYRWDGTVAAGPYQTIMPLGERNGKACVAYQDFEAVAGSFGRDNYVYWSAKPGTERWGVVDGDGRELCRLEAEYILCLDDNLMLVEEKDGVALTDFEGSRIQWFDNPQQRRSVAGE